MSPCALVAATEEDPSVQCTEDLVANQLTASSECLDSWHCESVWESVSSKNGWVLSGPHPGLHAGSRRLARLLSVTLGGIGVAGACVPSAGSVGQAGVRGGRAGLSSEESVRARKQWALTPHPFHA